MEKSQRSKNYDQRFDYKDARASTWIFKFRQLYFLHFSTYPIKVGTCKPLAQRLAKKYGFTFAGLFLLGILLSFINVPCAAPFLLVLLVNILFKGTLENFILLGFFSLGVLTPFVAIGVVGGGGPSLAIRIRKQYRQRTIRIISGLVLIGFGILLLIL